MINVPIQLCRCLLNHPVWLVLISGVRLNHFTLYLNQLTMREWGRWGNENCQGKMNEWMHKGWTLIIKPLHCNLQWSIVLPSFWLTLYNPTHWMKCRALFVGHRHIHLVPLKKIGPWDKILHKLQLHNHKGCVWLTHLFPGAVHKWGHLSVPVWKDVLLSDSKQS
jgi:hypothetical protein